ncbi:hypothetical protein ACFYKX_11085 [Cytobacillus sp. FJAT-54145]|uniref:Uncharacterized protein n=1 Tax=Cytobacillus spartinae TaxID=3299023 RepID=A0ABW6KEB1_9BACI
MNILKKLNKWLFGTGFEVGDRVFWKNLHHPEFTGEYVVTSRRDKRGFVGVYNEKMQNRWVRWFDLEPLD